MKQCPKCSKQVASHFFYKGVCIPCASQEGMKAESAKKNDHEVVEDVGCAGGACTL